MPEQRILLAMPSYDGRAHLAAARAFFQTPSLKGLAIRHATCSSSLLTSAFNQLWCEALNGALRGECTHFAMQHADVVPEAGWLDVLLTEMESSKANVLSAVIAMKNDRALTSTAIVRGTEESPLKLSLSEVSVLPATFGLDCVRNAGVKTAKALLVNTGLMLVDMRAFVAYPSKYQPLFSITDRLAFDGTTYRAEVEGEDWRFSAQCQALGLRVCATTKVEVEHWGQKSWSNQSSDRPTKESVTHG